MNIIKFLKEEKIKYTQKEDILILDLEQGSDKWLDIRSKFVTSTDTAIINGTNKRKTQNKLWRQKVGWDEPDPVNDKMIEGSLLEKEARDWYNKKYKSDFQPVCMMNLKYPWMFTSLDGYDKKTGKILEIKCGAALYAKVVEGPLPLDHIDQAQSNICISEQPQCLYLAYRSDQTPINFSVKRDQPYIDSFIPKQKEFYEYLVKIIEPPITEKEFLEITKIDADDLCDELINVRQEIKERKTKEKIVQEKLKDYTDGGNTLFVNSGVKYEWIETKPINYQKLIVDLDILPSTLEKYREIKGYFAFKIKKAV